MKRTCFVAALCLLYHFAGAQELVVDPQHSAAVVENGAMRASAESAHNDYLIKINSNLNAINVNAGAVVTAQTVIYKSLSNVNSALRDGLALKNMSVITADMLSYLEQALTLARDEPYLLLFAQKIEAQMQLRAVSLVNDVNQYVLKQGNNVLSDYNSRDQLMRKITADLQILDGLAYGAWRAMFWAQQRGLLASVNPYSAWISKDRALVTQIISRAKYLR
jgi:hypothetical protein